VNTLFHSTAARPVRSWWHGRTAHVLSAGSSAAPAASSSATFARRTGSHLSDLIVARLVTGTTVVVGALRKAGVNHQEASALANDGLAQ